MDNNVTTVELNVNGEKAAKTLDDLKARAAKLQEAIGKVVSEGNQKGYKELDKELKRVNKEMKAIISTTANVENVMRNLDKASPRELQETLKVLNKQLNNMQRGSAVWEEQTRKIRLVDAELKKVNSELKESKSWYDRLSVQINHYGLSLMSAIAGLTGIVQAGKKAVEMYADMEQEMANVRKFTDMTAEEVVKLNETFRKMDTRSSREQLNKLAQEAGRLGLQTEEDVTGFVKAADKINVALNDLGEGATLTISKLTDIFGDKKRLGVEKSMLAVGSAINELSQNSTASAPYLAEFAQRLAGVGAQAGMTIPQIMGFGAVLDSQGQAVEMSATSLSKLIMNLFKQADKIAAATGLNLKKFKDIAAKDTNEALIVLLERLHELGDMEVLAPMFKEMGENGVRSSQVLAALAGNIDLVKQQQLAANVAFEEAVSIDKEFNVQNTTVQARLEKARKGFKEIAVTLGKELMPIVSHMISGTSMLMRMMLKTVQFIKEYRTAIISTTAAIAAYYAVVKAQDAWNAIVRGAKTATEAVKAFNAALKANPWGLAAAAIAAIAVALGSYIKKMREAKEAADVIGVANKKAAATFADEKAKIDQLTDAVRNETLSLNYRQRALKELQALVPEYHASLTQEGQLINDNKTAIDDYLVSLQRKMQMEAYQEMLSEKYALRAKKEMELDEAKIDRGNKLLAWGQTSKDNPLAKDIAYNRYRKANNKVGALEAEIAAADDAIDKLLKKIGNVPAIELGVNPTESAVGDLTDGAGNQTESAVKNKFEEEDKWLAEHLALNQIAYYQGEKNFSEYTAHNLDIERQYQEMRLAKCEQGTTEYLQVEALWRKAQYEQNRYWDNLTLEEETELYNAQLNKLEESYNQGNLTARQYQLAKEDAELTHLQNIVRIYDEGSKEYIEAQENLEKRERQIQARRLTEAKRIQEELRKKYFIGNDVMSDEDYDLALQNLDYVRAQMLSNQKLTNAERLEIERAYELARYELALKCNKEISEDTVKSSYVAGARIAKFFNSKKFKDGWSAVNMIMSSVKDAMNTATEGIEAECERQVAAIEARYEKEISAAGKNEKRVEELEKKKEQEINAVRAESNKKTFGINVATAIADAAMSIVEAWKGAMTLGPIAGPVVGALLTTLITGITAGNIATMKKQQATAAGYYARRGIVAVDEGLIGNYMSWHPMIGWTPTGDENTGWGQVIGEDELAPGQLLSGPSHEGGGVPIIAEGGEAVINKKGTKMFLPILSAINEATGGVPLMRRGGLADAMRGNTLGTLSPADVSGSITANQRLASFGVREQMSGSVAAQAATSAATTKVLDKLNKRLNEPFVTMNTVTGDKGIRRAQRNYDHLMKNKSL